MKNTSTKAIVATGLGAALFMVLFMFVKIPSPIPETSIQLAYGIAAFFSALFGPVSGFLIAFIGHALNDFIAYGSPWWSWIFASGACGAIMGLSAKKVAPAVEEGTFGKEQIIPFVVYVLIAQAIAWLIVAPMLDILVYSEPANLAFTQGVMAFISDFLVSAIIGSLLLKAYAATKTGKGQLSKED